MRPLRAYPFGDPRRRSSSVADDALNSDLEGQAQQTRQCYPSRDTLEAISRAEHESRWRR